MVGFINYDGSALVGGLNPAGQGQALQVDAYGTLYVQDWLRLLIMQGKGFTANTGVLNVVAGNYGLSVFNPSNSGKNILIYSLKSSEGSGSQVGYVQWVTTDPAFSNTATVVNAKLGGPASAIAAHCTYANTNQGTIQGTAMEVSLSSMLPLEYCANGHYILLPAGANNGITLYVTTYAGGYILINAKWVEF